MTIRLGLFSVAICALAVGCGDVKKPGVDAGSQVDAAVSTADAAPACTAPEEEECGGTCVNTQTDDQHCGQCDMVCETGEECLAGSCECLSGTIDCDGSCIDPLTDPLFCGAGPDCTVNAGVVCTAEQSCTGGTCRQSLQNGSFETGDYTAWTLADSSGVPEVGVFALLQAGVSLELDPVSGMAPQLLDLQDNIMVEAGCVPFSGANFPVSIVSDGLLAGLHTQSDAARHTMTQDFFVKPTETSLLWDMAYQTAAPLDDASQFIAINVVDPGTGTTLATIYKTNPLVDPIVVGAFTTFTADLTPYQGQDIRLEFELMIQDDCFTVFFDNFRVQ